MRIILVSSILALTLFSSRSSAVSGALITEELNKYSDGIVAPRADVPLTTYNTKYSSNLEAQQKQLEAIYQKIFGLNQIEPKNFIDKAKATYLLENEIALFLQNIPTSKINLFEQKSLIYRGIQAYKLLRSSAEHTYDNALRIIDIAIPGPGGPQIRIETNRDYALYLPNFRSDVPLSPEEQEKFYANKLATFSSEVGGPLEFKVLRNAKDLDDGRDISSFEFVQTSSGEIRFTSGSAGHLLLSNAQPVRSAGSIVVVRNDLSEVLLLVVSNSSGTFKPDILSAEQTARKISRILKVPSERVVVTRGEPFGLQALKILMKAEKLSKNQIEIEIEKLSSSVGRSKTILRGLLCERIFEIL